MLLLAVTQRGMPGNSDMMAIWSGRGPNGAAMPMVIETVYASRCPDE